MVEPMDANNTAIARTDDRQTRVALILGIALWFLHQNVIYALASVSCVWGWFTFNVLGMPGLQVVEVIITLIAIALMAGLIYLPWRNWRAFQTEKPRDNPHLLQDTQKDRRSLMAFVAMLLNSFFFLFIIMFFVPMLALNACGQG